MPLKSGDLSKVPPGRRFFLPFCSAASSSPHTTTSTTGRLRIGSTRRRPSCRAFGTKSRSRRRSQGTCVPSRTSSAARGPAFAPARAASELGGDPSLLKSVSDLGKESGLEFLRFAPSAEIKKDFYAEIPVSISVNGDYHSFALFSDKVAHYPGS